MGSNITFSLEILRDMQRKMDGLRARNANPLARGDATSLWGIPVHASPHFPMQLQCSQCHGTGEGETSTYCPKCHGAGEIRYVGMCNDDRGTTLLTTRLSRKFEPYFPAGLVAMPPLCRGLHYRSRDDG